jgi:predicted dehydrogenase
MPFKFAIMGYRHGHINDLIQRLKGRADAVLAAVCEEEPEARAQLAAAVPDAPVFDSYARMLEAVECDAIGIGDYYSRRGAIALEALRRGKHVLSDKPLCTRLAELEAIEALARERRLCVGLQLDLRAHGLFRALRRLVRGEGAVGEVHALSFNGQHPLLYGTRPAWYFEEGKQGGTINDIAIHAIDAIPWFTGLGFKTINAARNWNAKLKAAPHFRDAAQMLLTLENGGGVLGDVSYFAPDSFRYSLPQYWRFTVWGAEGVIESSPTQKTLVLYKNGATESQTLPPDPPDPGGYFEAFLRDVRGERAGLDLDTAAVLRSSRLTLRVQEAADAGRTNVLL